MRFEVPQFIEIEDKIFGPFTWRQFVYLIGGVGGAIALFLMTHIIIFILFGLPIGGLAILLAFYPVNNRPFSIYLESMVNFFMGDRLFLWRKKGDTTYRNNAETAAGLSTNFVPTVTSNNISSLSRKLELNAIKTDGK